jgi:hypothetical protein
VRNWSLSSVSCWPPARSRLLDRPSKFLRASLDAAAERRYGGPIVEDPLIQRLRARARELNRATDSVDVVRAQFYPCLSERDILTAERLLGFPLPPTVRRIYTAIGNGGFGPAYGLLGLLGGATDEDELDAVHLYLQHRRPDDHDPHWCWPDRLLPIGHLGCAMSMCVDCTDAEGRLIWFEPNPHSEGAPWSDSFIPFPVTLVEWLERWLDGADDLFEAAWNAASGVS